MVMYCRCMCVGSVTSVFMPWFAVVHATTGVGSRHVTCVTTVEEGELTTESK